MEQNNNIAIPIPLNYNSEVNLKEKLENNMKSKFKSLIANDYVHAGYEACVGAIAGYAYPVIMGQAVFNIKSAKIALAGAIILGLRKAIKLYYTNSKGQFAKIEPIENK